MRRVVSGEVQLPLRATEAIGLFTPEGERDWVPGWNPVYSGAETSEAPGTVFTTAVGGVETVWLILEIDRARGSASYSRVTPGSHAGTVRVSCTDTDTGGCKVCVTYDVSALPGVDPKVLDAFDDAEFEAMLDEWARLIGP